MPRYELNRLGAAEFENLVQALLKEIVGDGTVTFGAGQDGGREATFEGTAPYPSSSKQWSGNWLFQVKFHDVELQGVDKCRKSLVRDIEEELDKTFNKYGRNVQNYIFATNVALSGRNESGTHDVVSGLFKTFEAPGRNFAIWGADDINRFLEKYCRVRTSYLHLIVPGDLIASLLDQQQTEYDATSATIESYLQATFTREQYAQLDQAGDVSEEPVKLQQVFFELHAKLILSAMERRKANESLAIALDYARLSELPHGDELSARLPLVQMFLETPQIRVVLVGGPGEGKSTAGQYLAQLHRAQLLGNVDRVAISDRYQPSFPRLPFRVILRDFGQWLSEQRVATTNGAATLEDFLCSEITSCTSRTITPDTLHEVIKRNPTLLILDGLDEITDPTLKKDVIDRAEEFIGRAEKVLKTDLQVLATTRPTGYNNHFDPDSYVHCRLTDVQPAQIRNYVDRYANVRKLDDARGARLKRGIEDCLNDRQIRLLMNTPLQITILVLIIVSGGTPPRQREGLFNQYLEVIYKREQNKGSDILRTSKELLVDLHKYIGYELQERATHASATDATLSAADYSSLVEMFLEWNDPFSPDEKINARLKSITVDAGERLVLIVEPSSRRFGFELRSLQEFFAACHLVDTSRDTQQRYQRFEAIARLPHWRNVALFFAGRVGRNFSGEAANIVEVCRSLDRSAPDDRIRRGAQLALEIAFDRAFLPNRWLQNSVIELALEVLDSALSPERLEKIREVIVNMPEEDVSDHIVPILEHKLQTLLPELVTNAVSVMTTLDPTNGLLVPALRRMVVAGESTCRKAVLPTLLIAATEPTAQELISNIIECLGVESFCDELVRAGDFHHHVGTARLLAQIEGTRLAQYGLVAAVARQFYPGIVMRGADGDGFWSGDWSERGPELLLRSSYYAALASTRPELLRRRRMGDGVVVDGLEQLRGSLHSSILEGDVDKFATLCGLDSSDDPLLTPFWQLHTVLGDATAESVGRALSFFDGCVGGEWDSTGAFRFSTQTTPVLDYVLSCRAAGRTVGHLDAILSQWSGISGVERWIRFVTEMRRRVDRRMSPAGRSQSKEAIISSRKRRLEGVREALVEKAGAEDLFFYALEQGRVSASVISELYPSVNSYISALFTSPVVTSAKRNLVFGLLADDSINEDATVPSKVLAWMLNSETFRRSESVLIGMAVVATLDSGSPDSSLIDKALRLIGQQSASVLYTPFSGISTTDVFQRLFGHCKLPTDEDVKRGALKLIRSMCVSLSLSLSPSMKPPRFGGLADLHRRLAKSDDIEERMAGAALYLARKNWGESDSRVIYSLFKRCKTVDEENLLVRLLDTDSQVDEHQRHKLWSRVLVDLLDEKLYGQLDTQVRDSLIRVLASSSQSLAERAESLSLPLARRARPYEAN